VPVLPAIVDEEVEPHRGHALHEPVEQLLALRVDPLQILDDQQHRPEGAEPQHQRPQGLLCQLSPAQRIVGGEGAVLGEDAEQGLQRGHRLLEAEIAHGGRDPIPDHLGRLVLRQEEVLAQQLQDGEIRDALAVGDGGGLEHHAPGRRRGVDKLEEQPGLADADLTDHRGDAAVAGEHPLLDARELVHFQLASHEVGEATQRRHLDAPHRARAHELEDLDRRVAAAHGERAERLGVEQGLGEGEGGAREPDGPGRRHLLHPGGQVCRLADGGEIHVKIVVDRADHHHARIQPDANRDRRTVEPREVAREGPHAVLHVQGGIAGARGMVLVGGGRPEQRHDPVAHDLVHRTLVAVHGGLHELDDRIEEDHRLLGVARGQELERALDVGEHDRDELPLALEGSPPLREQGGQMQRRAGGDVRGRGGLAAFPAEARATQRRGAARGADCGECGAAALAEPGSLAISGSTAGAVHGGLHARGRPQLSVEPSPCARVGT
jgi:hypothetical protein